MGKPGPKFCLDNENKTKKKEKKNLRFWRGTEKKYFPSFSKGARFSDFFFILIQQCHSKHNTCIGLWGRGDCRAL